MRIDDLCFGYGEKKIFMDFSADIDSGIICLMGPSGCGKTTLLHIMAGLIVPERGLISDFPERRSIMFQEDRLLPWLDARGNVALVLEGRDESDESGRLLERLGMDPAMPIGKMSGGMKRRVALARALAFGADALLLDEPFKGMDEDLMKRCAALIRETGKPAVVSTHSEAEARALGAVVLRLGTKNL